MVNREARRNQAWSCRVVGIKYPVKDYCEVESEKEKEEEKSY